MKLTFLHHTLVHEEYQTHTVILHRKGLLLINCENKHTPNKVT